jgi:23S rRNA (adenine2503-C2)-methyltransferase
MKTNLKIIEKVKVPTGEIYIGEYEGGMVEFLSIADYGKERNVKADFLGLTNRINGVENGNPMPLSEKWVITTSTQYGCSMKCSFCDVPKVGHGRNISTNGMVEQVLSAVKEHPEVKYTKRLNHHFARMGEPTFNPGVLKSALILFGYFRALGWNYHPVVSTMMPRTNINSYEFVKNWIDAKNSIFNGEAGLQLSINSTDEKQRKFLFGGEEDNMERIAKIMRSVTDNKPCKGRKITLNFAITDKTIIDAKQLSVWFPPSIFMVKITPIHETKEASINGLKTTRGYSEYSPYIDHEENLKQVGFDVIVFVPSEEEDESRITCGNAILSKGFKK